MPSAWHLARRFALVAALAAAAFGGVFAQAGRQAVQAPAAPSPQIAALSEPGGYFDTDNLISNERSYLQVDPGAAARPACGAAPTSASVPIRTSRTSPTSVRRSRFIVDIRRDNLLLHLLFKALFAEARTRVEYLALLDRPVAAGRMARAGSRVDRGDRRRTSIGARRRTPLRAPRCDWRRVAALRRPALGRPTARRSTAFIGGSSRPDCRCSSTATGRAPQIDYPTYRDLLLEDDRAGRPRSFLASEDELPVRQVAAGARRVVPVVGDLSGPTALAAVGALLARTAARAALGLLHVERRVLPLPRRHVSRSSSPISTRLPRRRTRDRPQRVSAAAAPPACRATTARHCSSSIQQLLDGYARGQFRQVHRAHRSISAPVRARCVPCASMPRHAQRDSDAARRPAHRSRCLHGVLRRHVVECGDQGQAGRVGARAGHGLRHQFLRHARHRLVRTDDGDLQVLQDRARSADPGHAQRRPHAADDRAGLHLHRGDRGRSDDADPDDRWPPSPAPGSARASWRAGRSARSRSAWAAR